MFHHCIIYEQKSIKSKIETRTALFLSFLVLLHTVFTLHDLKCVVVFFLRKFYMCKQAFLCTNSIYKTKLSVKSPLEVSYFCLSKEERKEGFIRLKRNGI